MRPDIAWLTSAGAEPDGADAALAHRHAPLLRLDGAEPFRPVAVGFAVYRQPAKSVSSKFAIAPDAAAVIEYAIYWDHDIRHLYDLEHVWAHVDAGGATVRVEASFHGRRHAMGPAGADGRPALVVEPGGHAHYAGRDALMEWADRIGRGCGADAGDGGVHTSNLFGAAAFGDPSPRDHRLAGLFLKRRAFAPAFDAAIPFDTRSVPLVPWPRLAAWIPGRVRHLVAGLPQSVPHLAAVFLDCGDTLVDEGTEVKDPRTGVVQRAELVAGARQTLDALKERGYRLALVADGPRGTFENVLGHHGLWNRFETHAISGDVGVLKPAPAMFRAALAGLGLDEDDGKRVVMVGNNLARDIEGANALGMISVFFDWSDRRPRTPRTAGEVPAHTIRDLSALPALLDTIERALAEAGA